MRASLAPNAPRVALSRTQRRAPGGRGVARNRSARITTRASSSPIDVDKTDNAVDGVGFSAAGMIFPYHVGAWQVLRERGLMTPDTPVAGASAGALVAAMHACGPYKIDNIGIDAYLNYSTNQPSSSIRAPTAPQTCWALEQHMDEVADAIGMDPAELRRRTLIDEGVEGPTGQIFEPIGAKQTLEAAQRMLLSLSCG